MWRINFIDDMIRTTQKKLIYTQPSSKRLGLEPKIGCVRSRPAQLTTIFVSVQTTLKSMLPHIKSSPKRKSRPDGIHSEAPQKRAGIPPSITMSDNVT